MKKFLFISTLFPVFHFDQLMAQTKTFIPTDVEVPEKIETQHFRLRMLTVNDVVKDYDAVMTSIDHLQGVFGPNSKWPSQNLTLEQDLIDLGWHQKEFQRRSSFGYTVLSLDESLVLGCVYIFPSGKITFALRLQCGSEKVHMTRDLIRFSLLPLKNGF